MTVHGAKGLEAPIVILPDTAQRSEAANPPQLLRLEERVVWRLRGDDCPPPMAQAEAGRRAQVAAENRRLLYVALTRAKTWMIVAGAGKPGEGSWHAMVGAALAGLGAQEEPTPEGGALALSQGWRRVPGAAAGRAGGAVLAAWALRAPPPPPLDEPPLSPCDLGGAHSAPGEGADEGEAKARGSALHLLLETLPHRPRARWPDLAARLLPDAADLPALLSEAEAVLDDPALAELFADGALAEVCVTAPLAPLGGRRVLGRIDRLVVRPNCVLAVDFKSNVVVPDAPAATPEGILRQMGAYAAALAAVWPDRAIETAVLWTRRRRLMPLPPALTAAALLRAAQLDPADPRP
jgi:ATP-dependent helicase/nuclease subunit A